MIFESTDPLKSREQFASRRFLNLTVLVGCFIVFALFWSALWLLPLFVSATVSTLALVLGYGAGLVVVYYFCLVWEKRPIRLRCPRCRKFIVTNTPWVCGYCRKPNLNPVEFPFVNKCEHLECNLEPKTYRCHLCNEFIYLTPDKDQINYAYRFNSPADTTKADKAAKALKEERERKRDDHREKMISKGEELDLVKIAKQIAEVRQKIREARMFGARDDGDEESPLTRVKSATEKEMEWEEALKELRKFYYEKYGSRK